MALERYYSLFFSPYLKPIVGTLGGYWVLSREQRNEERTGTSFMPSFSAPEPWSKANPPRVLPEILDAMKEYYIGSP